MAINYGRLSDEQPAQTEGSIPRRRANDRKIVHRPKVGTGPESERLIEDSAKLKSWRLWGPYLSERQWGTVREDYSPNGDAWSYTDYQTASARTYRWGEDGIGGVSDEQQRLCLALTMWNGRDAL